MAGRRARARRPGARSQHFLRSPGLAAELVRDAGIAAGDTVVDIGAGSGRLTEQLARVAARVIAVEIDPRLARGLRGRWPNVEVIEGDAAEVELPREPFRVVANPPFHCTTALLRRLLGDPAVPLVRADLVLQWDVAVRRALPWPSSVNGVVWSAFHELTVARRLPAAAFVPPPDTDAGVLVVRRRAAPLVAVEEAAAFQRFVAAGFRHGLGRVAGGRALRSAGIARGRIARDLDAHEWASLFRACARGAVA